MSINKLFGEILVTNILLIKNFFICNVDHVSMSQFFSQILFLILKNYFLL